MLTPVLGRETDGSYDVVLTNPPFGERLKIRATDAKQAKYSICQHTSGGYPSDKYSDTELGLVFMERAYRLLAGGGRLGIVLPERQDELLCHAQEIHEGSCVHETAIMGSAG